MHFGEPSVLNALLAVPLLWLLLRRNRRRRALLGERFASAGLLDHLVRGVDEGKRRRKEGLTLLALAGVIVALAHPQYGERERPMTRQGIDIVFALDTSLSMLAEDLKPNRLELAKGEVERSFGRLQGDRVGIVAFAGTALPTCPLTIDYGAARIFLAGIDPWTVPRAGTAIADALRRSLRMLEEGGTGSRVVVLLTDGEDHEGEVLDAAEEAAKAGVRVFTVALGSREGELIPMPPEAGEGRFKKDRKGELVVTRLDESVLRQVAEKTGGSHFLLGEDPDALDTILDEISGMEKREFRSRMLVVREERFAWFLLPATLLLVVEFLLGTGGKKRREAWRGRME
jgi:Ca-activated chloride channel family protein